MDLLKQFRKSLVIVSSVSIMSTAWADRAPVVGSNAPQSPTQPEQKVPVAPMACEVKGEGSFFEFGMNKQAKNFAGAANVLTRLHDKAKKQNDSDVKDEAEALTCLDKLESTGCQKIKEWVEDGLPKLMRASRVHLALAQESGLADVDNAISTTLKGWGGRDRIGHYRHQSFNDLTPEERQTAQKILDEYKRTALRVRDNMFASGNYKLSQAKEIYQRSIMNDRRFHFQQYLALSRQHLFLQHLKSAKPTVQELKIALKAAAGYRKAENKSLEDAKKEIESGSVGSSALKLLHYAGSVETDFPDMDKGMCAGLNDAFRLHRNRSDAKSMAETASMGATIAGALAMPVFGWAGLATAAAGARVLLIGGVATQTFGVGLDYLKYTESRERLLSRYQTLSSNELALAETEYDAFEGGAQGLVLGAGIWAGLRYAPTLKRALGR